MTAEDSDPRRDALHQFLQQQGPPGHDMDGALLTGWIVILEWVAPDGEHWLSRGWAPTTSHWTANGMMHEALFGEWPDEESGDESEDDG